MKPIKYIIMLSWLLITMVANAQLYPHYQPYFSNNWSVESQEVNASGVITAGIRSGMSVMVVVHRVAWNLTDPNGVGTYYSKTTPSTLHTEQYHIASQEFFVEVKRFDGVWKQRVRQKVTYAPGYGGSVDYGWSEYVTVDGNALPYDIATNAIVERETAGGIYYYNYSGILCVLDIDPNQAGETGVFSRTISARIKKTEVVPEWAPQAGGYNYIMYGDSQHEAEDHPLCDPATINTEVGFFNVPVPPITDLGFHALRRMKVIPPNGDFPVENE